MSTPEIWINFCWFCHLSFIHGSCIWHQHTSCTVQDVRQGGFHWHVFKTNTYCLIDEHFTKCDFVPLEWWRVMLLKWLITTKMESLVVSQTKTYSSSPAFHPAVAFRKMITIAIAGLYFFWIMRIWVKRDCRGKVRTLQELKWWELQYLK